MRRSLEPDIGWVVVLAAISLVACGESHTEPVQPTVEQKSIAPNVSSAWTTASATLSVSNESVDEQTGHIVGDQVRYRFAVSETKEADGWRATFLKQPSLAGELPDGMSRRPSGRNLSRIEVDTKGTSRAFSVDGSSFPRNQAALSALLNDGAKAPSWYSPAPRPTTKQSFVRHSLIAGLVVDSIAGQKAKLALTKRFGAVRPNGDGDETFTAHSGDTARVIVFRPRLGAILAIETTVRGQIVSRTEYSFETRSGQTVRTQIRTLRRAPARTGAKRLLRTTLSWADVRVS